MTLSAFYEYFEEDIDFYVDDIKNNPEVFI